MSDYEDKGRSMSYSDYYSNNSKTPADNTNLNLRTDKPEKPNPPGFIVKQRREALKRRLNNSNKKVRIS